jgi:hypothetical protein
MKIRSATATTLAALMLAPGFALAEQPPSLEEIVAEMASTPAHHAALAEHYRKKAEATRAEARRHESMARAYKGGKQRTGMAGTHCKRIADSYRDMAGEYDDLAKQHAEQAK